MKLQDESQAVLLTMCGWCHRIIGEDEEHLARGVKTKPEVRSFFRAKEGQVVVLPVTAGEREVLVIVPRGDSPAAQQGYDLILQTCSEKCAANLDRGMEAK
jgi:hypothetical protein